MCSVQGYSSILGLLIFAGAYCALDAQQDRSTDTLLSSAAISLKSGNGTSSVPELLNLENRHSRSASNDKSVKPTFTSSSLDFGKISFIRNQGQFAEPVRFQLKRGTKTVGWITDHGIEFEISRKNPGAAESENPNSKGPELTLDSRPNRAAQGVWNSRSLSEPPNDFSRIDHLAVFESLVGGDSKMQVEPRDIRRETRNYLIGNDPTKWHRRVQSYGEVLYRNVWNGIDLRVYGKGADIEQEFIVAPGADTHQISVSYQGIKRLQISEDGSLHVRTAFGEMRETAPKVFQEIAGKKMDVKAHFKILANNSYTFEIDSYDTQHDLIIDPTLLFSTYIGGAGGGDVGNGVTTDPAGNSYVVGYTYLGEYPTTPGVYQASCPSSPSCLSAVVSKFDPLGRLVYSTYLGSAAGYDSAQGIAVNSNGEAYLAGYANTGFPTTPNAFQTSCAGASEFVSKLDSMGAVLLYSTCLGYNAAFDHETGAGAHAIAVDARGRAYVTGSASYTTSFPSTPDAIQPAVIGDGNAFMSIIDPSLSGASSLVYSTFLGSLEDSGQSIAVDGYGNGYLTGFTISSTFPITAGAFQTTNAQTTCGGSGLCPTAFVAKINPSVAGPSGLIYSTYLGGTDSGSRVGDTGYGIAVDSLGNAYVTGATGSPNFPTTAGVIQPKEAAVPDGFVSKLNAAGNSLVYSTYLGEMPNNISSGDTSLLGISIDSASNAYVVGQTRSSFYPVTPDASQNTLHGYYDGILTKIDSLGKNIIYSSYLGGSDYDVTVGVTVDPVGDVIVTGHTNSTDFPISHFAFQPTNLSGQNCGNNGQGQCPNFLLSKFPLGAPQALSVTGILPNVGGKAGTVSPQIIGTGFHAGAFVTLSGPTQIVGTSPMVGPGGRTINTTFDLTAALPGAYNVVVTNADGTISTLPQGFTVQQGGSARIALQFSGVARRSAPYEQVQAATNASYIVTVTNTGNVDYGTSFLAQALEAPLSIVATNPLAASATNNSAGSYAFWGIQSIPAGLSSQFQLSAATPLIPKGPVIGGPISVGAVTGVPSSLSRIDACIAENTTIDNIADCANAIEDCNKAAVNPTLENTVNCIAETLNCYQGALDVIEKCVEGNSDDSISIPVEFLVPTDPNNLVGIAGVGTSRWVSGRTNLSYVVSFSNEPMASGPAQQVVVTQPLGSDVNLSSLNLLSINIPNGKSPSGIQVTIPLGSFNPAAGVNEFQGNVDLRPTQSLFVAVDVKLDPSARVLTWLFQSIDPTTGLPPLDPSLGVLPAGAAASVSFSVTPNAVLATGTQISDQATVVFDLQPPMSTVNWVNTLDSSAPASRVAVFPGKYSCLDFKVKWSGTDVGSGIQDFTIYASDNGGLFTPWLVNSPVGSATYQGQVGHLYRFYSIARDRVGNLEPAKTASEASTIVVKTTTCGGPPSLLGSAAVQSFSGTTLTLNLQVTNNGKSIANNITLASITPRVLSGAGKILVNSPTLPFALGSLAPGESTALPVVLTVPVTVTQFALSESGNVQDGLGKSYGFTLGQEVSP